MQSLILKISIIFSYYILGAYSTTDILRLTKYNSIPINASKCYCPICQTPIRISHQIPIFSYMKNKGRCKTCNTNIPKVEFFLEISLFLIISICTVLLHFSMISYLICILVYEGMKIAVIIYIGPNSNSFKTKAYISIFHNFIIFILIALLFFLHELVQ